MARGSSRFVTPKVKGTLPNAELDVLACLWKDGPTTARNIREMMLKYRPMAHGSVVTLLTRLEAKGYVTREKGPVGKAFIYRTKDRAEGTHKRLAKDMLSRVFNGNLVGMASALFAAQPPNKAEAEEIKGILAKSRR
jgi:BlaI family penicillinase repressor